MRVLIVAGPRKGTTTTMPDGAGYVEIMDPWRIPGLGERAIAVERTATTYVIRPFRMGHPEWGTERFIEYVGVPVDSKAGCGDGAAVLAALNYLFDHAHDNPTKYNV